MKISNRRNNSGSGMLADSEPPPVEGKFSLPNLIRHLRIYFPFIFPWFWSQWNYNCGISDNQRFKISLKQYCCCASKSVYLWAHTVFVLKTLMMYLQCTVVLNIHSHLRLITDSGSVSFAENNRRWHEAFFPKDFLELWTDLEPDLKF